MPVAVQPCVEQGFHIERELRRAGGTRAVSMRKRGSELRPKRALMIRRDAIDHARLVLGREGPGRKGAIRAGGLSPLDFCFQHRNLFRPLRNARKLRQVETGHVGFAMNAGDECSNRMALERRGHRQNQPAQTKRDSSSGRSSRACTRLAADGVQRRARLDAGQKVDDISCFCAHHSASFNSSQLACQRHVHCRSFPAQARAQPWSRSTRSTAGYADAADRSNAPETQDR